MRTTYSIQQYPGSVVVTDANPQDPLSAPDEPKSFSFPFGVGELYANRAEATAAAEWFLKFPARIL